MRNISINLKNHLQGSVLTIANCVLIQRTDGVQLGFTSLDIPLILNGVTYQSTSSISASAINSSASSGVDNMQIHGILSSNLIIDEDVRAGLYSNAVVTFSVVNWMSTADGQAILLKGRIGDMTLMDGQYVAEFRSLSQLLKQQVGRMCSYSCTVRRLGDNQCKVNIASFTTTGISVTSAASSTTFTFGSDVQAASYYQYGIVHFTSGRNIGIEKEIKSHTVSGGALITLRESFPYPVIVGDVANLIAGCDRLITTCTNKFANSANYHGFPHLPGSDRLVQTGRIPLGG